MSWSLAIPAQSSVEEFIKAVGAAQLPEDTYNKPELIEQWNEQLAAAKEAVLAIVMHEGAFGHSGVEKWTVSFTGHANHGGAGDGTDYTQSEFVHLTVNRQPEARS